MSQYALAFLQHLPQSELCNRSMKVIERWKKHHVLISEMEIIHDGWLIKLSSDRRLFRKKRWNKYWFVLLHSAHHSGQVILEYYKDSNCHNLRGRIDLGQCEQLDSGLYFGKEENITNNGFDIKTGNKTYCLIAETEIEMNNWVGCISSVCGLKLKVEEDHATAIPTEKMMEPVTSPPLMSSAANGIHSVGNRKDSSSYILISECFTGKPVSNWPPSFDLNYSYPKESGFHFPDANYDYPRPTCYQDKQDASFQSNFIHELYQVPPPPRICETDFSNKTYSYPIRSSDYCSQELQTFEGVNLGNNIFMYNSGPAIYHENSEIEIVRKEALQLAQQLESLGVDDTNVECKQHDLLHSSSDDSADVVHSQSNDDSLGTKALTPPPRPPKPPDLHKKKNTNFNPLSKQSDTFVFPLLPKSSCTDGFHWTTHTVESVGYNEFHLHPEVTPTLLDDMYDIPKPRSEDNLTILLTASGLHSKARNFHVYDNAPPIFAKSSEINEHDTPFTLGCEMNTFAFLADQSVDCNSKDFNVINQNKCYDSPPLVNRNLKPKKTSEKVDEKFDQASAQSSDKGSSTQIFCNIKENNQDKRIIDLDVTVERPLLSKANEIQYLDLNLDDDVTKDISKLEASQAKRSTVYKTVDFLRTEAFNKTRQKVEAEYRSSN